MGAAHSDWEVLNTLEIDKLQTVDEGKEYIGLDSKFVDFEIMGCISR